MFAGLLDGRKVFAVRATLPWHMDTLHFHPSIFSAGGLKYLLYRVRSHHHDFLHNLVFDQNIHEEAWNWCRLHRYTCNLLTYTRIGVVLSRTLAPDHTLQ